MPNIKVSKIVATAVFEPDGDKLLKRILKELENDPQGSVKLDFSDIDFFATPFFNACIGHLVLKNSSDYVTNHIVVDKDSISPSGWDTYCHALDNAIYIKNREADFLEG